MRRRGVKEEMRARLRALSRAPDTGWSAPLIAQHLECGDKIVRRVLSAFRSKGTDALERQVRGPALDLAQRHHVHAALKTLPCVPAHANQPRHGGPAEATRVLNEAVRGGAGERGHSRHLAGAGPLQPAPPPLWTETVARGLDGSEGGRSQRELGQPLDCTQLFSSSATLRNPFGPAVVYARGRRVLESVVAGPW